MPLTTLPAATLHDPHEIIYCGDSRVVIVDDRRVREDAHHAVWSWTAEESPEIAPDRREWFRAIDECKPAKIGRASCRERV